MRLILVLLLASCSSAPIVGVGSEESPVGFIDVNDPYRVPTCYMSTRGGPGCHKIPNGNLFTPYECCQ